MKTHTNTEVVIVEGFRTPFVRAGGQLKDMPAEDLGTYLLKELLERTQIATTEIEEIIISNTTGAPDISNIAHIIAQGAGLSCSVPATTIRAMSAMETLTSAVLKIKLGLKNTLITGGVESLSNLPVLIAPHLTKIIKQTAQSKTWKEKAKQILLFKSSDTKLNFADKALFIDPILGLSQGQKAEKLSKNFHISREEQDNFALNSFKKACEARKKQKWAEKIVPIFPPTDFEIVEKDMELEKEVRLSDLSKLKPCFDLDCGTVTLGNSSVPADGALLFLIMNKAKAKSLGYNPLVSIHSFVSVGATSHETGLASVSAVDRLLKQAKLNIKDISLLEVEEIFSAEALAFLKQFNSYREKDITEANIMETDLAEKCNVNGGALALGNPLSASSARMVLNLTQEMQRRQAKWGLVVEGAREGQGHALLLKNETL